jgi:hypothetical protein
MQLTTIHHKKTTFCTHVFRKTPIKTLFSPYKKSAQLKRRNVSYLLPKTAGRSKLFGI